MNVAARAQANRRVLRRLLFAALAMFGFGYALTPLYAVFCDLTGLNRGAEQALAGNTQVQFGRLVQVQFDASNAAGMPWRFRPLTRERQVHPGALVQIEYEIENLSDERIVGQAVPSYAPQAAGAHFRKIECFCFRAQTLEPREVRRLPVLFVLDRSLPEDMKTLTLSYTFFRQGRG